MLRARSACVNSREAGRGKLSAPVLRQALGAKQAHSGCSRRGARSLSFAGLRRRIVEERLERLARLGAALLLKFCNPAGYGCNYLARRFRGALFRGLSGGRVLCVGALA